MSGGNFILHQSMLRVTYYTSLAVKSKSPQHERSFPRVLKSTLALTPLIRQITFDGKAKFTNHFKINCAVGSAREI